MNEKKAKCTQCNVEILQATADRTGGLCMPCKNGTPKRPDLNTPVEVRCEADSMHTPNPVFYTTAQLLLEELNRTRHIGDSSHPNRYELEAQRALLCHAIGNQVSRRLNDDTRNRTKWAIIRLFEAGKANMKIGERTYQFEELEKCDWRQGDHPFGMRGGFIYRTADGVELFKAMTWLS